MSESRVAKPVQLTRPFSRFAVETNASRGFRNSKFEHSALQDAVRCQQTHELSPLLRIGPLEYLRSLGGQFDELAAETDSSVRVRHTRQ
jgi:hypothetical protein